MFGTAAAASSRSTVIRTISDPARAKAATCFAVASASAVSVLVIDWTTTGTPPPTVTLPTLTATVWCRGAGLGNAITGIPQVNLRVELWVPLHAFAGCTGNALHIASPRAVDEEEADGDQRHCDGQGRCQRLMIMVGCWEDCGRHDCLDSAPGRWRSPRAIAVQPVL